MQIREDHAWLLQSRINPLPIAGALALADDRITFTLDPEPADAPLSWLEEELGMDDLARRLESGETVVAFDLGIDECAVSWPITGGGALMHVQAPGGRKWVVAYDQPQGGSLTRAMGMMSARRKAREWKRILVKAQPPSDD